MIIYTATSACLILFFLIFILVLFQKKNHKTTNTQSPNLEALKSLPYLSYVVEEKNIERDGVVLYEEGLCNKGINLYNSLFSPGAYLFDLSGNILHQWLPQQTHRDWHFVEMSDEGDLLVIIRDVQLMRLDWNSNIKWTLNMRFHHDIAIDENKDIYVLARKDDLIFNSLLPFPILNDFIIVITPQGRIKREISLYRILEKRIPLDTLARIYQYSITPKNLIKILKRKRNDLYIFEHDTPVDIFHVNTIEIINRDINDIFRKGNILFCSKMLNLIGVIDIKEEKLLWSWGTDRLELPHHPTLLENGNILIFDNGAINREYSRIIELNPSTEEIIWEYKGSPPSSFYTLYGGSSQRLPNGNTLITETAKGRVFEITREGKIVWEFYNPHRNKYGRSTIYRMMRLTEPDKFPKFKE
jgi:hypothetical protein